MAAKQGVKRRIKPVKNVTLDQEVIDVIEQRRKQTGLSFSAQVNKDLQSLFKNVNIELININ